MFLVKIHCGSQPLEPTCVHLAMELTEDKTRYYEGWHQNPRSNNLKEQKTVWDYQETEAPMPGFFAMGENTSALMYEANAVIYLTLQCSIFLCLILAKFILVNLLDVRIGYLFIMYVSVVEFSPPLLLCIQCHVHISPFNTFPPQTPSLSI